MVFGSQRSRYGLLEDRVIDGEGKISFESGISGVEGMSTVRDALGEYSRFGSDEITEKWLLVVQVSRYFAQSALYGWHSVWNRIVETFFRVSVPFRTDLVIWCTATMKLVCKSPVRGTNILKYMNAGCVLVTTMMSAMNFGSISIDSRTETKRLLT